MKKPVIISTELTQLAYDPDIKEKKQKLAPNLTQTRWREPRDQFLEGAIYPEGDNPNSIHFDHDGYDSSAHNIVLENQQDLKGFQFRNCYFKDLNAKKAILNGVYFDTTNLSHADFRGADFEGAYFDRVDLTQVKIDSARNLHLAFYDEVKLPTGFPKPPSFRTYSRKWDMDLAFNGISGKFSENLLTYLLKETIDISSINALVFELYSPKQKPLSKKQTEFLNNLAKDYETYVKEMREFNKFLIKKSISEIPVITTVTGQDHYKVQDALKIFNYVFNFTNITAKSNSFFRKRNTPEAIQKIFGAASILNPRKLTKLERFSEYVTADEKGYVVSTAKLVEFLFTVKSEYMERVQNVIEANPELTPYMRQPQSSDTELDILSKTPSRKLS